MSRYIPMPAYPDMMPVDISFVFADEKPAGKHGFCQVDGENFRFEDGSLICKVGIGCIFLSMGIKAEVNRPIWIFCFADGNVKRL